MMFQTAITRYQQYRLPLSALLSVLGICWLAVLVINNDQHQYPELLQEYAHAITHLTNSHLAVAISDNNLISLQSQLNGLIEQPRIASAIVYDVDNQILVQAGQALTPDNRTHQSFTVPVTLDNSVLGSLTLMIRIPESPSAFWLLVAAALIIIPLPITFLSLAGKHLPIQPTTSPPETPNEPEEPQWQTQLLIHINNLDKLSQQLNGAARLQLLEKLQTTLTKTTTLYSGQSIRPHAYGVIIDFADQDRSRSLLNAICSGHLLKTYCQQECSLMSLSLYVINCQQQPLCSLDKALPPLRSTLVTADTEHRLFIAISLLDDEISHRLKLETDSDQKPFVEIEGLTTHYQQLLDNQLSRLQTA